MSAVGIVQKIIEQAIDVGASDIHLESLENGLRVRFRLDGVLYDQEIVDKDTSDQVISRIKVLAGIDIAQKRIPQDGKFKLSHKNKLVDFRVSTFPSSHGQKIVIRILDKDQQNINLENLGFLEADLKKIKDLISKNHGFILVTGPTGSGKTTTLYAALQKLHTPEKNIITLEDPVEYNVDNITQGQIQEGAGFTFSQAIRALLRQDPDIAMIGEIRDRESAKIAIEASLTGHLVFSTLHTNDACSAVIRLMDMGIDPYLIKASLTGVLAQRLARKICVGCKESCIPSTEEQELMDHYKIDLKKLFKGSGCSVCNQLGYKGRTGIYELLILNDDLKNLIDQNPNSVKFTQAAEQAGMRFLLDDAKEKLSSGIISLEELIKAIY